MISSAEVTCAGCDRCARLSSTSHASWKGNRNRCRSSGATKVCKSRGASASLRASSFATWPSFGSTRAPSLMSSPLPGMTILPSREGWALVRKRVVLVGAFSHQQIPTAKLPIRCHNKLCGEDMLAFIPCWKHGSKPNVWNMYNTFFIAWEGCLSAKAWGSMWHPPPHPTRPSATFWFGETVCMSSPPPPLLINEGYCWPHCASLLLLLLSCFCCFFF